jgi:hypothetical protein
VLVVRRSTRRKGSLSEPLWRRLDRVTGALNPFLAAISVGLLILDLTCLVAVKLVGLPPAQLPVCTTAQSVPTPPSDQ